MVIDVPSERSGGNGGLLRSLEVREGQVVVLEHAELVILSLVIGELLQICQNLVLIHGNGLLKIKNKRGEITSTFVYGIFCKSHVECL